MGKEKKYFWLKLMDNFFTQPRIKKLRKIAGGDTYTIIYLKMQLLSLNDGGRLFFEGIEENIIEEIALTIDEEIENVEVTFQYLLNQGLIEEITKDEYLMPETKLLIGSETSAAERMRKHRNSKKALQCYADVTTCYDDVTNCYTDIDIEKDINKEYICANRGANAPIESANEATFDPKMHFEEFWNLYPKKVNKKKAKDKFCKVCKSEEIFKQLTNGLNIQIKSKNWLKENGQYIPHPTTWLNGERWNDEIPKSEINKTVTYEEMRENDPFFEDTL